jgi:hypothetical protein
MGAGMAGYAAICPGAERSMIRQDLRAYSVAGSPLKFAYFRIDTPDMAL